MDNIMFISIGISLVLGLLSITVLNKVKKAGWIIFLLNSIWQLFVVYTLYTKMGNGELIEIFTVPVDILGFDSLNLTLKFSHLGFIFFAASSIVTFLFAVFSLSYNDKKHITGVAPLWTMLMGANIGIFFAADWITFLLSWELMGWTSYFIISQGKKESAKAGLYYFILSLIGTAALLAAVMIMIIESQSLMIIDGIDTIAVIWGKSPLPLIVVLLLTITFFAKSAVFPFYMWPSKAHAEAPDDFSAFLSGVMIKYGIFGLIAFVLPLFKFYEGVNANGVPLYLVFLGAFGAITAVWGTLHAIRENDMKRLMAYSTVGNIGYITAALSVNTSLGIAAALFHTFNHMVFKGGIFLSMASVKYRTGERLMHKLGGMAYRMPVAFFTFLLSIIAAAGIPPMSGFGSKWMIFQSFFDVKFLILAIPIFFASTGAFMYLFRGLHTIYLGQLSPRFYKIKAAPPLQSIIMIIIMLLVFLVGFFPGLVTGPINDAIAEMGYAKVQADMSAMVGSTSQINLTIIGSVFMGAFILVFIFFIIGKKREIIRDPLDRYTSAEPPDEWGLTPERYHFGYNFYDYFENMINPLIDKISFDRLFKRIAYEFGRISGAIQKWYKNPNFSSIILVGFIILIIVIGWVVI